MKKENIDWIKVRKERRIKLLAVKQDEIEGYILIDKLPNVSVVSTWDMPENWIIGGVQYDFKCNAFLFIILSPEFESIPDGLQFQVMLADQHVVKVTKEIISDVHKINEKEIKCCAECEFVGKEAYHGAHIWCAHPIAFGLNLPNKYTVIHPDCPIGTFKIVRHIAGEYDRNLREYLRGGD